MIEKMLAAWRDSRHNYQFVPIMASARPRVLALLSAATYSTRLSMLLGISCRVCLGQRKSSLTNGFCMLHGPSRPIIWVHFDFEAHFWQHLLLHFRVYIWDHIWEHFWAPFQYLLGNTPASILFLRAPSWLSPVIPMCALAHTHSAQSPTTLWSW